MEGREGLDLLPMALVVNSNKEVNLMEKTLVHNHTVLMRL